jgi:hypothetical protein
MERKGMETNSIPNVWFTKIQWKENSNGIGFPPKWWNGLSIHNPMERPFQFLTTFSLPKITLC